MFINMDHTYYTDEFLDAYITSHAHIELTADVFVPLKDEYLDEMPIPSTNETNFLVDFGLNAPQ